MKLFNRQVRFGEVNMLPMFCVGVVAGFFLVNIGKSTFIESTGLFDESVLSGIKYMSVDGSTLFYYVLRKRMLAFLIMAVLATTYLGFAVCACAAVWCGMASGAFVSVLTVRYGMKGLILAAIGVFPQYLFYIPAIVLMLKWCIGLYRAIYSRGSYGEGADKIFWLKKLGRLGVIGAIVVVGCLMEGYVNPRLLIGYLKVF